jgi:hypothetical protein
MARWQNAQAPIYLDAIFSNELLLLDMSDCQSLKFFSLKAFKCINYKQMRGQGCITFWRNLQSLKAQLTLSA